MKKTITLLLAAASMAVGANELTLQWKDNTASLASFDFGSDNAITIALAIDMQSINSSKGFTNIVTLNNTGTSYAFCTAKKGYYTTIGGTDSYFFEILYDAIINTEDMQIDREVSYAVSIFTLKNEGYTYSITSNLYLWDEDMVEIDSASAAETFDYDFGTYSTIAINEAFAKTEDVRVFDVSYNNDPDMLKTIATSFLPVPEPTTATLSLLALAGLAARRRRR